MWYVINGVLDFTKSTADEKEFLKKLSEILKDLNISFEGKLDPIGIAADPALEDRRELN